MKKTFGKVLVALLVTVAFVGLVGCQNGAGGGGSSGGGGGYTPKISSAAAVDVLGTYTSGSETLIFNDDLTGSYNDGTSGNSRAITNGNFTWTATGTGTITIIITQGSNSETATLSTSGNSNKIQFNGKSFDFKAPTESDIIGKTFTLIYPSTSELDRKLTNSGAWYPIKLKFNAGGTASSTVRANTGSRVEQLDKTGYWAISGDYISLLSEQGNSRGQAKCKISGNRSSAWTVLGLLVYEIQ